MQNWRVGHCFVDSTESEGDGQVLRGVLLNANALLILKAT